MNALPVAERADADLVMAARTGDHQAFGELYERYSPRIYTLCVHMLRDRHEAEDVTGDVFLRAAERIGQLRDPAKCRSWLYTIARHEVYRRCKRRNREVVSEIDETMIATTPTTKDDTAEILPAAEVRQLLRDAALGLDDRDRMVMELTMAGGLEGKQLGEALGLSENGAHQATHRMRERLARSVGALLVTRQGRASCPQLAQLTQSWDGTFTVLWRKRVARHVEGCETCERRRRAIPAALLDGAAFAAERVAFLHPPAAVRDRVERELRLGRPPRGRWLRRAGLVAILVIALVVALASQLGHSSSSGPAPPGPQASASGADGAQSGGATVVGGRPTTTGAGHHAGGKTSGATPTTSGGTIAPTTTMADTTGPSLTASVPAAMVTGCPNQPLAATASDPSGVSSVSMHYGGPASGTLSFTPTGGSSWTLQWNPPADGTYSITVTATDGRGNTTSVTRSTTSSPCIP